MAKRTAVIDIGSNSVRIVIFEKTSRFAFHLLRESKSRVRIGEGAYKQEGILTDKAMERAFETIKEFVALAHAYSCRKILAVATSALRDAPNKKTFTNRVARELNLNIRIIDGDKEAYYGGIAAVNMLTHSKGVTIDIGGGSTELALIEAGLVTQTASLNLGTVRLKELFENEPLDAAIAYIQNAFQNLDTAFFGQNIIGIGGTIRAIASAYAHETDYPIKVLHGFTTDAAPLHTFSQAIVTATPEYLAKIGIKPERFDVIGMGALIFTQLLSFLQAKKVTASSVGVREGVFLEDLLRSQKFHRFPQGINPAVQSMTDRYVHDVRAAKLLVKTALELFDLLAPTFELSLKYREILSIGAKLAEVGIDLNFHDYERHSFYLILHSLYGFSHKKILLIATLVRYQSSTKPSKAFRLKYQTLLPGNRKIKALIFLLDVASAMLKGRPHALPFEITYEQNVLVVRSLENNFLAIEKLKKIEPLIPIEIRR